MANLEGITPGKLRGLIRQYSKMRGSIRDVEAVSKVAKVFEDAVANSVDVARQDPLEPYIKWAYFPVFASDGQPYSVVASPGLEIHDHRRPVKSSEGLRATMQMIAPQAFEQLRRLEIAQAMELSARLGVPAVLSALTLHGQSIPPRVVVDGDQQWNGPSHAMFRIPTRLKTPQDHADLARPISDAGYKVIFGQVRNNYQLTNLLAAIETVDSLQLEGIELHFEVCQDLQEGSPSRKTLAYFLRTAKERDLAITCVALDSPDIRRNFFAFLRAHDFPLKRVRIAGEGLGIRPVFQDANAVSPLLINQFDGSVMPNLRSTSGKQMRPAPKPAPPVLSRGLSRSI